MEMYAKRKGWNVDGLEVDVRLHAGRARLRDPLRARHEACPPTSATSRSSKLQVIAAKCPVHRTLEGEVAFDERVELT